MEKVVIIQITPECISSAKQHNIVNNKSTEAIKTYIALCQIELK